MLPSIISGKEIREEYYMLQVSGLLVGIVTVVFGIIVMMFPKILNYLIGIYLIVIGAMAIIQAV